MAEHDDPHIEKAYLAHIEAGKCKEVMRVSIRWRQWCDYKAVTDAGYCRIHDPECKRERADTRWKQRSWRKRKVRPIRSSKSVS